MKNCFTCRADYQTDSFNGWNVLLSGNLHSFVQSFSECSDRLVVHSALMFQQFLDPILIGIDFGPAQIGIDFGPLGWNFLLFSWFGRNDSATLKK